MRHITTTADVDQPVDLYSLAEKCNTIYCYALLRTKIAVLQRKEYNVLKVMYRQCYAPKCMLYKPEIKLQTNLSVETVLFRTFHQPVAQE